MSIITGTGGMRRRARGNKSPVVATRLTRVPVEKNYGARSKYPPAGESRYERERRAKREQA